MVSASDTDVLANGNFEQGFVNVPGCGIVGAGWNCFTNGGGANYGFYDDQWEPVVADGKHSQLIEINGKGLMAPDHDRYAGLSQTVRVAPWGKYTFTMRAMVRTTNLEGDPWRYRVEVGWAKGPNADWRHVDNWTDAGINTYFDRLEPDISASSAPLCHRRRDYRSLCASGVIGRAQRVGCQPDGIALIGPSVGGTGGRKAALCSTGRSRNRNPGRRGSAQSAAGRPQWSPSRQAGGVRRAEPGLQRRLRGRLQPHSAGRHRARLGRLINGNGQLRLCDEQWEAVVSMANRRRVILLRRRRCRRQRPTDRDQLQGMYPTDADRYASIFQRIGGLTPVASIS